MYLFENSATFNGEGLSNFGTSIAKLPNLETLMMNLIEYNFFKKF